MYYNIISLITKSPQVANFPKKSNVVNDEMPRIVVFFLAHAGITQQMMWVNWYLQFPPDSIAFRVFCPPPTFLARPYFKRLPFFFSTTWGSQQIVYAMQEGYKLILDEFPDVEQIFLVSGSCIPIGSPSRAFEVCGKSFVSHTVSHRGRGITKDRLPLIKPRILAKLNLDQPKFLSTQWIHLNNKDARKIVDFPLWKMQEIQVQYQRSGIFLIPDEFWPCYILRDSETINFNLTEQDRRDDNDPSPILWTGRSELISGVEKTLQEVIQESRDSGALFYRKVSADVKF